MRSCMEPVSTSQDTWLYAINFMKTIFQTSKDKQGLDKEINEFLF